MDQEIDFDSHEDLPVLPPHSSPFCWRCFVFMKKILQIQKSKSGVDTREKLISFLGLKKEKFEECFKVIPLLYEPTPIPKKNNAGYRKLSIPKQELRDIQRCVLDKIFADIKLPSCAYGFSSGKSIIENAKYHSKSDYLLNLDIKDFFPSVHFERVMQIFRDLGFNDSISEILCILTTYNHELPQGAPTSPLLASLALSNLDKRLTKLAETNHVLYSRYFDDISFSGGKRILALEETIKRIVRSENYKVNTKRYLYGKGEVKEINGISISSGKLFLKNTGDLLVYLEDLKNFSITKLRSDDPEKERKSLAGKVSFLKGVNKENGAKAENLLKTIKWP